MILNIETEQPEKTLDILKSHFLSSEVTIKEVMAKITEYEIKPKSYARDYGYAYNAECILELASDISLNKIRLAYYD